MSFFSAPKTQWLLAALSIMTMHSVLVRGVTPSVYGYTIHYCGDKVDQIQQSVEEALYYVETTVLEDVAKVRSETQHRDAFLTYFKGTTLRTKVAKVFSDMVDVQRSNNIETNEYRIYCLQPGNLPPERAFAYLEICVADEQNIAAFEETEESKNIFICPSFWRLPLFPRVDTDCPLLRNNKMGNTPNLCANQMSAIIHELAHAHGVLEQEEIEYYYDQDAADLHPDKQLENAQNFALYAACMSMFSLCAPLTFHVLHCSIAC